MSWLFLLALAGLVLLILGLTVLTKVFLVIGLILLGVALVFALYDGFGSHRVVRRR